VTEHAEHEPAHPRVAAGALFFDADERVMFVQPSYKDYLDIPGGYVETGETPYGCCVREVAEELGIQPTIGPLLVADWAPNERDGDKLLFVFDGGQLTHDQHAAIRFTDGEITAYAYHPAEAFTELLIPRLAARLTAAVHAHRVGHPLYLEHGKRLDQLPN
jgi:8-oxo-dGTP pyrophosphatase MutT (NUDIX family)